MTKNASVALNGRTLQDESTLGPGHFDFEMEPVAIRVTLFLGRLLAGVVSRFTGCRPRGLLDFLANGGN